MNTEYSTVAIEVEKVAKALRERLDSHNKNRKETQDKLHMLCKEFRDRVNEEETTSSREAEEAFARESNELQTALDNPSNNSNQTVIYAKLEECDEKRRAALETKREESEGKRKQIGELEDRINSELEDKFKEEDNRLQSALNSFLTEASSGNKEKASETLQKAKAELLVLQRYDIKSTRNKEDFSEMLELTTEKEVVTEWLSLVRPEDIKIDRVSNKGRVSISFTFLTPEEERALAANGLGSAVAYKASLQKKKKDRNMEESGVSTHSERKKATTSLLCLFSLKLRQRTP